LALTPAGPLRLIDTRSSVEPGHAVHQLIEVALVAASELAAEQQPPPGSIRVHNIGSGRAQVRASGYGWTFLSRTDGPR
jgi:hypothetical protein